MLIGKEIKFLGLLVLVGLQLYEFKVDEEYMGEFQLEYFCLLFKVWCNQFCEEVDCMVMYMKDEVVNFFDFVDCVV